MTTTTTAAVVYEPGGQFALETVELDDPRGDEILIRVDAAASVTPTSLPRER